MSGWTLYAPLAAVAHHIKGPPIDWVGFSPFVVLAVGALVVLLVGLLRGAVARERVVPILTILTFAGAIGFEIARFHHHASILSGALEIDDLALVLDMIFAVAGIGAKAHGQQVERGQPKYYRCHNKKRVHGSSLPWFHVLMHLQDDLLLVHC
jgi:hypothetical protein